MTDRLWFLASFVAGLFMLFVGRLFDLQVINGSHYAQLVEQSRLVSEVLVPRRGRIVDRQGTPIADTRPIYNLGVTYSELELRGRARRELPFWRLDEKRLDALVADLGGRTRWVGKPLTLRDAVVKELLNHPGVAVRSGKGIAEAKLGLVAVPRTALSPTHPQGESGVPEPEGDLAQLAESDLLADDPREALVREIAARWSREVQIVGEEEFASACARLDQDFALGGDAANGAAVAAGEAPGGSPERSAPVLDPFIPPYLLRVPSGIAPTGELIYGELAVRIIVPDRRTQAEATLARVLGESQPLVHERLERALAAARQRPPTGALYYGASAAAEQIAPLLPDGQVLAEVPVADVPGARERVLIVQGDPPDGEGLCTQICRRIAANLGADPDLVQALLIKHAERIRAITCERDYRIHHMGIDPERLSRLANGLARSLTELGRPTTRLDVDSALAKVRRSADKEWAGQTRYDALALFADVPHALAVRLWGGSAEPPRDLLKDYEDAFAAMPGLVVQVDVGRAYPFPTSCCHYLGRLGRAAADRDGDDAVGLLPGSLIGVEGLERKYDVQLRGVVGSKVRVRTPNGVRLLRDNPAIPGSDLVTELDMELQTLSEDSLDHFYELAQALGSASDKMDRARAVGRGRAGFCLIDCHTGGILALASSPRFRIEDQRDAKIWNEYKAEPQQPRLHDHASEAEQPPGSSFKILTALACLEDEVIRPSEEIYCQGYMAKQGDRYILRDHAPPGTYDLPHAIQVSSNVYFATIAARLAQRRGEAELPAFASLFGIGENNAWDASSQRRGLLPSPDRGSRDWIGLERMGRAPAERHWFPNDTWRMGIGQFATASPLQCVVIAAAVANGGHIVRPFLVRPQSGPPEVKDLHIRKEYLDQVRRGMELVTENEPHATGKLLVLEGEAKGIKVAAKTGTSEWGSSEGRLSGRNPDHAWMIGYAPADNPTVAFACFIYCGTFGGQACTPVAKRVLEMYFRKYGREGHAAGRTEAAEEPAPAATPAPEPAPDG
jgi:penicillin-binding protein 2